MNVILHLIYLVSTSAKNVPQISQKFQKIKPELFIRVIKPMKGIKEPYLMKLLLFLTKQSRFTANLFKSIAANSRTEYLDIIS